MSARQKVVPLRPAPRPAPPRRRIERLRLRQRVYARPDRDHPGRGEIRAVSFQTDGLLYDVRMDDGRWVPRLTRAQLDVLEGPSAEGGERWSP